MHGASSRGFAPVLLLTTILTVSLLLPGTLGAGGPSVRRALLQDVTSEGKPEAFYDAILNNEEAKQMLEEYAQGVGLNIDLADPANRDQAIQLIDEIRLEAVNVPPLPVNEPLQIEGYLSEGTEIRVGVRAGTKADPGRFPYMASLRSNADGDHFCGGTLIAPNVVLSAAHCFYSKVDKSWNEAQVGNLTIVVGRYFRDARDDKRNGLEMARALRTVPHPKYKFGPNFDYDVAVIKLDRMVDKQPVQITKGQTGFVEEYSLTVLGWGAVDSKIGNLSNELRMGPAPYIPSYKCKDIPEYQNSRLEITDNMMCAGSSPEGNGNIPTIPAVDACRGDSGGPLIEMGKDYFEDVQFGIVSFGLGCQEGLPGIYTKMYADEIRDFIWEQVLDFNSSAPPPLPHHVKPPEPSPSTSPRPSPMPSPPPPSPPATSPAFAPAPSEPFLPPPAVAPAPETAPEPSPEPSPSPIPGGNDSNMSTESRVTLPANARYFWIMSYNMGGGGPQCYDVALKNYTDPLPVYEARKSRDKDPSDEVKNLADQYCIAPGSDVSALAQKLHNAIMTGGQEADNNLTALLHGYYEVAECLDFDTFSNIVSSANSYDDPVNLDDGDTQEELDHTLQYFNNLVVAGDNAGMSTCVTIKTVIDNDMSTEAELITLHTGSVYIYTDIYI